jgi:alginate O-acetyltransferase complex protein AlgI
MLFSSYGFIFLFLPATLLAFTLANRHGGARGGILALVLASLVFYAAWDARLLALLLGSVGFNFLAAHAIAAGGGRRADLRLAGAIAVNLGALAWCKYAGFFAATLNAAFGAALPVPLALLPLGISFFTFEQIAYLVDVRRGGPAERDPRRYALFVVFFPRLVAGPILRFSEIMPQVPRQGPIPHGAADLAVGLTLFAFGLAKKALLADGIAGHAHGMFDAAAGGAAPDLFLAWGGVLAYTLQIYFDFSGYSDMAIGLARCCGLRFPTNFDSPYKASSIIAFWRRWHMTLSRFLRDYLYFALGGNRRGPVRRYANLMATMLLGGLWHGANWTFVAWGGLHGLYLMLNHAWAAFAAGRPGLQRRALSRPGRALAWALTMLAVMLAWVFFRAPDFATAARILGGMAGLHGAMLPAAIADHLGALRPWLTGLGVAISDGSGSRLLAMWGWGLALAAIALALPNTQQIMRDWAPVLEQVRMLPGNLVALRWQPTPGWAMAMAGVAIAGLIAIGRGGEFIYWQF